MPRCSPDPRLKFGVQEACTQLHQLVPCCLLRLLVTSFRPLVCINSPTSCSVCGRRKGYRRQPHAEQRVQLLIRPAICICGILVTVVGILAAFTTADVLMAPLRPLHATCHYRVLVLGGAGEPGRYSYSAYYQERSVCDLGSLQAPRSAWDGFETSNLSRSQS